MLCNEVLMAVTLLGASPDIDFETKQTTGYTKLDVGFRNAVGKYITRTIKIGNSIVADFSPYLDEKITLKLENVTFSPYLSSGRANLSIKAESVTIEV